MGMPKHRYKVSVHWTGNEGYGTQSPSSYNRNHRISASGKYENLKGSSDPAFKGDKTRYNPEDLLVSSISACHMLCYLHLCAVNGIVVIDYQDIAEGVMEENRKGGGEFIEVILHPKVKITDKNKIEMAHELHVEANDLCFIANSCNFKIRHKPEITTA